MTHIVNTEVLKSNNSFINSDLDKLNDEIQNLKNSIFDVGNYWQGTDHDFFEKQMDDFLEEVNKFFNYLDEMQIYLSDYVKKVEKIEDKYSSDNVNFNFK